MQEHQIQVGTQVHGTQTPLTSQRLTIRSSNVEVAYGVALLRVHLRSIALMEIAVTVMAFVQFLSVFRAHFKISLFLFFF